MGCGCGKKKNAAEKVVVVYDNGNERTFNNKVLAEHAVRKSGGTARIK